VIRVQCILRNPSLSRLYLIYFKRQTCIIAENCNLIFQNILLNFSEVFLGLIVITGILNFSRTVRLTIFMGQNQLTQLLSTIDNDYGINIQ